MPRSNRLKMKSASVDEEPRSRRSVSGFFRHSCAAALGVGLLTILGAIALLPAQAEATSFEYDCGLLAPGTWCEHPTWHNYNYNAVAYYGQGNLTACEKTIIHTNGALYQQACGTNGASAGFAPCACYALIIQFGNTAHYLYGYAAY